MFFGMLSLLGRKSLLKMLEMILTDCCKWYGEWLSMPIPRDSDINALQNQMWDIVQLERKKKQFEVFSTEGVLLKYVEATKPQFRFYLF
jgi:hypothetical protein